jgi:hypothetical protein
MRRLYLSGPMSGHPGFNYDAFHAEAARLRALGYHVENPAENPAPACAIWQNYMRQAIAQLVTCDTIALLPGWNHSRGARVEYGLAISLDLIVAMVRLITEPAFSTTTEGDDDENTRPPRPLAQAQDPAQPDDRLCTLAQTQARAARSDFGL